MVERYCLEAYEIIEKYANGHTYWQVEAMQAIHTTMCMNILDFYTRRVPLVLAASDHGLNVLNEVAEIFKREFKLSDSEINQQKNELNQNIQNELDWKKQF